MIQRGNTRIYKYKQNSAWIIALEQNKEGTFFDGHVENLFLAIKYNGKDLSDAGCAEAYWYDGYPEEDAKELKAELRKNYIAMSLNVDVEKIFNRSKCVFDYIENPIVLGRSEYVSEHMSWEGKYNEWIKFSQINFMRN